MEERRTTTTSGIGLTGMGFIVSVVFMILKLTGVITWSWFWVAFPFIVGLGVSIGVVILAVLIVLLLLIIGAIKENYF